MLLKWVALTPEKWLESGLTPDPYALKCKLDTPSGHVEYIVDHLENHMRTENDYEYLGYTLPQGALIGDTTLNMLRVKEEGEL
jgi:hypothetical protein